MRDQVPPENRRKKGPFGPMRIEVQKTLKSAVTFDGLGLHSGQPVRMTVRPAPADHGIVFHRTDVAAQDARVPARWDTVIPSKLCTLVGNAAGVTVSTIDVPSRMP
jgi:UDP-3-O-[3-hydroxymyristoyl] N-acetylglucosamine deacetylase